MREHCWPPDKPEHRAIDDDEGGIRKESLCSDGVWAIFIGDGCDCAEACEEILRLAEENARLLGELADIKAGLIAKHVPNRVLEAIGDGTKEEGRTEERERLVVEIKRLSARGTTLYEGQEMGAADEGFREALDDVLDFLEVHEDASTTSPSTTSSDSGS